MTKGGSSKYIYAWLVILLFGQMPALSQSLEIAEILNAKPRGSEQVQGLWLYNRARALTNANAAYELMSIITDEFSGDGAVQARLWKIRYHLAGDELDEAATELHQLPEVPHTAVWEPQSRYWQTLIGESGHPDPSSKETGVPPWTVMTHLAAMPASDLSNRELRRVLALESVVRRWGLSGPWLWRLVRSDNTQLKNIAKQMLVQADADLQLDPVLPAIKEMLAEKSWFDDTPVPPEPVFQPTELPGADILPSSETQAEAQSQSQAQSQTPAPLQMQPSDTTRIFAVQVGAFLNVTAAKALARELRSHGFGAYCREPDEIDLLYRVRIAPANSASEAESLGNRLSETLMLPYQIIEEL